MSDLDNEEIIATRNKNFKQKYVSKEELKGILKKYSNDDVEDGGLIISKSDIINFALEIIDLIGGLDV